MIDDEEQENSDSMRRIGFNVSEVKSSGKATTKIATLAINDSDIAAFPHFQDLILDTSMASAYDKNVEKISQLPSLTAICESGATELNNLLKYLTSRSKAAVCRVASGFYMFLTPQHCPHDGYAITLFYSVKPQVTKAAPPPVVPQKVLIPTALPRSPDGPPPPQDMDVVSSLAAPEPHALPPAPRPRSPDGAPPGWSGDILPPFEASTKGLIPAVSGGTTSTQGQNGWTEDERAAAGMYSGLNRARETQGESRLYHMRRINNAIKAALILRAGQHLGGRKNLHVLDLACGKLGDWAKWMALSDRSQIDRYVGVDIADGSLDDGVARLRDMNHKQLPASVRLALVNLGNQSMAQDPTRVWQSSTTARSGKIDGNWTHAPAFGPQDSPFHVASMQFALHYMFQSKPQAQRFFREISDSLAPGGQFIATTVDSRVMLELLMGRGVKQPDGRVIVELEDCSAEDVYSEARSVSVTGMDRKHLPLCRFTFQPEVYERLFRDDEKDDLCGLRYDFALRDDDSSMAVDAPEWMIPMDLLAELAAEAGLRLCEIHNFHDFVHGNIDESTLRRFNCFNWRGTFTPNEWEVVRLYLVLRIEKPQQPAQPPQDSGMGIDDGSVLRMLRARAQLIKELGEENWKALTNNEQNAMVTTRVAEMP